MRKRVRGAMLVLWCAGIVSGFCAWGQANNEASNDGHVELAIDFDAARANTVPGYRFWMEGGSVQATGKITRHWGAAADLSALHAGQMPRTAAGLDLTTAVFGPRYSMTIPNGRFRLNGLAMGGVAHGSNSLFPNSKGAESSASGIALLLGGGLDYRASHRVSVRVIDAGWLRSSLSNGTTTAENNLRLGSGVVLFF